MRKYVQLQPCIETTSWGAARILSSTATCVASYEGETNKMRILQGVVIGLLVVWVILATLTTLSMNIEYPWTSWAIVALGPVFIIAGVVELVKKVMR